MTMPNEYDLLRLRPEPQGRRRLEAHLDNESLALGDPYTRFQMLNDLRKFLDDLRKHQVTSLSKYYNKETKGFNHRYDTPKKNDYSRASTATCVASLVATGGWQVNDLKDIDWNEETEPLAGSMLHKVWQSADLPINNPFTVGFILEACQILISSKPDSSFWSIEMNANRRDEGIKILTKAIIEEQIWPEGSVAPEGSVTPAGSISIGPYPPSAYLTQLVVRTLSAFGALTDHIKDKSLSWAWSEINSQLALIEARSKNADYFQLAYSIVLVAMLSEKGLASPDQKLVLHLALDRFFGGQLQDGTWPRSRPLFHYPTVGNAYCFEYELLVQMMQRLMQRRELVDRLLYHLPEMDSAARALTSTRFQLGDYGEAWGWSSGHHPQIKGPESWSTASVYHFAHQLDRVVAEAIRSAIFRYFGAQYDGAVDLKIGTDESGKTFASDLLDSTLKVNETEVPLKEALYNRFVKPIFKNIKRVQDGGEFSSETPMSAIFFGPPGTSKTELANKIADFLGWPLLSIDPSHLVRSGMDRVQSEADRLFNMLASTEQLVVLLDEFDEMVRDRAHASDVLSRFLTTAMLPKLVAINKRKRIVFIVATNYIDEFDLAISRQGRFDMLLQVMPPTLSEKLDSSFRESERLGDLLDKWGLRGRDSIGKKINQLTYGECKRLVQALIDSTGVAETIELIEDEYRSCTLNSRIDPRNEGSETWAIICERQASKVRLPMQRVTSRSQSGQPPVSGLGVTPPTASSSVDGPSAGLVVDSGRVPKPAVGTDAVTEGLLDS